MPVLALPRDKVRLRPILEILLVVRNTPAGGSCRMVQFNPAVRALRSLSAPPASSVEVGGAPVRPTNHPSPHRAKSITILALSSSMNCLRNSSHGPGLRFLPRTAHAGSLAAMSTVL